MRLASARMVVASFATFVFVAGCGSSNRAAGEGGTGDGSADQPVPDSADMPELDAPWPEVGLGCDPGVPPGKLVLAGDWDVGSLASDGAHVAAQAPKGKVVVVSAAGGAPITFTDNPSMTENVFLDFAPIGLALAGVEDIDTTSFIGTLKVWTPERGTATVSPGVDLPWFTPDGKYLVFADQRSPSSDGQLFEIATGKTVKLGRVNYAFQMIVSGDSKWVVGATSTASKIWIASTATGGAADFVDGRNPSVSGDQTGVIYYTEYDVSSQTYTLNYKDFASPGGAPGTPISKGVFARSSVFGSDKIVALRNRDADALGEMAVVSHTGGTPVVLAPAGVSKILRPHKSGGVLYTTTIKPDFFKPFALLLLPPGGGPSRLLSPMGQMPFYEWSQDGSHVSFQESRKDFVGTTKVVATAGTSAPVVVDTQATYSTFLDRHRLMYLGSFNKTSKVGRAAIFDAETGTQSGIHGSIRGIRATDDGKRMAYSVAGCGATDGIYILDL